MDITQPDTHTARLEQLMKIQQMVLLCQRYLHSDEHRLAATPVVTGQVKCEVQRRVQFRRYVLGRLRAYYAKKVFQLASETYNQQLQLTGKATV